MKAIDKNINFAGEKAYSYSEIFLLSIFKYCQLKLNSNESTNNHINSERIYKQTYNKRNNEKREFRGKVNYSKKYKVKTIEVNKTCKETFLWKTGIFHLKKQIQKKEISNNPIIWDDDWKIIPTC